MYKTGDKVRIVTEKDEVTGIFMPRPEILDNDFVVVKLENGYNIGIKKERIREILLVEKYIPTETTTVKIKYNPNLPTISVLSTGGTISSRIDYRTGGVHADYTAEDFVQMLPHLASIANIKAKKVASIMSEDMCPSDWRMMARAIRKEFEEGADGVVITHGTDTLHFSTAAVSFMLKNLTKPVVFTASQRSIDRGSSDAFINLGCAIIAAASDIAEVMTCLHGTIDDEYCLLVRGTKVRKMHSSRRDAFRPINENPIAKVFPSGKIETINQCFRKRSDGMPELDDAFEPKVALVLAYPGMEPEIIDFYIAKGYKGIVISASALGHVPTNNPEYSILPSIERATGKNIPVVIASQTIYGRVHPYVYTNLRKLSMQLGCIYAEDMLPEVAYVKLGWVLGHTQDKKKIKDMMLSNIAGEISERSNAQCFLF
ncbi:MAG: Glu-tRNA(Gln) amidotransferase subunit GatD [Candidatus Woesearchaeota archaeon]